MSRPLGFANAVRGYGDYWRTGTYQELERQQPQDKKLIRAFILASGQCSDDSHEALQMGMLVKYREDYACGAVFSGRVRRGS